MSFSIKIIAAVSLYLLSANSFSGDLFDMLKRMSDADQNQNYQGVFILRKSDKLSTLLVRHGIDSEGVWEMLESLSGEPRKIVRRNEQVVSVFPKLKTITIRKTDKKRSLHAQLPDNIDQLSLFYTMTRLDDDRIANHETLVVDLLPKDNFRYGYRYWIDKNTGMLLRCDLLDETKRVVEQMMFTSLEYLTESPAEKFDLNQYNQYQVQKLGESISSELSDSQRWVVNTLPKGFMLKQSVARHSQSTLITEPENSVSNESSAKTPTDKELAALSPDLLHLVYSDGLASVSVFIEKHHGAGEHLHGASAMGAVNAFGRSIGDYFVTVVGEVPANTVQSMALSTVKFSK